MAPPLLASFPARHFSCVWSGICVKRFHFTYGKDGRPPMEDTLTKAEDSGCSGFEVLPATKELEPEFQLRE